MIDKKSKKPEGVAFYHIRKELGLTKNSIVSLITQGELKLNDYDRIDETYYNRFKEKWNSKPDWMKRK